MNATEKQTKKVTKKADSHNDSDTISKQPLLSKPYTSNRWVVTVFVLLFCFFSVNTLAAFHDHIYKLYPQNFSYHRKLSKTNLYQIDQKFNYIPEKYRSQIIAKKVSSNACFQPEAQISYDNPESIFKNIDDFLGNIIP